MKDGSYSRRAKGALSLDFPALSLIPWVILGQCTVYYWHADLRLLSAVSCLLSVISWRIWPFLLGLVPALIHYEAVIPQTASDVEVLVQVETPIRRRVPGEVRFRAHVLEAIDVRAPKPGSKIQCEAVELPWRNGSSLEEGDVLHLRGDFSNVTYTANPFSFDANLRHSGVSAKCRARFLGDTAKNFGLMSAIREKLQSHVMNVGEGGEDAGLLLSLVLGTRDVVTERTERAFREAGLSHLLVASGYQVTLIFGLAALILRTILIPEAFRFGISLLLSWIFVAVSGGDSSVIRAGFGLTLFVLFSLASRRRELLSITVATVFSSIVIWPGCIFDPGLNLSFGALLGLSLGDARYRSSLYRFLSVSFYATLSASLVSLLWFGGISPISFLLNLILPAIVSPVACIGGILSVGISFFGFKAPLLEILHLASLLRDFVIWVSSFGLSSGKLDAASRILVSAPMVWILWRRFKVKRKEYEIERGVD